MKRDPARVEDGLHRRARTRSHEGRRRALVTAIGAWALVPVPTGAAQPVRPARIGIIEFGAPPPSGFARAYVAALERQGYSETATLVLERRWAHGDPARLPAIVDELAARRVDIVFCVGNDIARVAKRVAPALPVVVAGSEDPVKSGLIDDYRRPGGNVTGVTYLSTHLAAKRLELLKAAVPNFTRAAMLSDPTHFDTYYRDMAAVATALGVKLQSVEASSAGELDDAFAAAQGAGAEVLFVVPSRMLNLQAKRIADLALAARLPSMAAYANFTEAGGLMSYGAVAGDLLQRAAVQTAKILRGARPGDLPFEQAATFELVINLKTASALSLVVPQSLRVRADRLVE